MKNSREFKKKVSKARLPKGYELISLDATSLFTNVSKELTLMAINKKWTKIRKFTHLPKEQFIEGLSVVLDNCCFQYDNIYYRQSHGSPMGSPVAPHLADLVLEILQDEVIRKLGFNLPFFYRYVDDIITAVPFDKKQEILAKFNSYNDRLQFTIEHENDENRIAFLDVLCIRQGQSIRTDWYHKSTWSGRYLNYHSHLPMIYKRNTVSILTQKILELADVEFHQNNFMLLKRTLCDNGYPKKLVYDIIKTTTDKFNLGDNRDLHKESKDQQNMVAIPYVAGLFEDLKKELGKHDIKAVAKPDNNLKMSVFSQIKDRTPMMQQSNVVYEIPCTCGKKYSGRTEQKLGKRVDQHKYYIATDDQQHSGLCEHAIQTGHKPRWSGVKIVHKEKNKQKLNVLESIAIKRNLSNLNRQQDSQFLPVAYTNVI